MAQSSMHGNGPQHVVVGVWWWPSTLRDDRVLTQVVKVVVDAARLKTTKKKQKNVILGPSVECRMTYLKRRVCMCMQRDHVRTRCV